MPAPVHKLKKSEIMWLANHKCKAHHHSYLEHYSCYLREHQHQERIGFFDIETSNLNADYGIMLSYAIKDSLSDKVYGRILTAKEIQKGLFDRNLVKECINDFNEFDRIVTYYGTKFDIPFVRTRALLNNIDFPTYGGIIHDDLYYIVRHKFKLHRNSLDNACSVLLGDSNKTRIDPTHWLKATMMQDKKSLDYIWEHNIYDVIDTERLYNRIIPFKKHADRSA